MYGQYDYSAHPFEPIGMEVLVHEKTHRRKTFAEHCSKGHVLGTSFEHYRAWTMWMTKSKATRVLGKVFHKHKYLTNPGVTPEDRFIVAMGKLSQELGGKKTNNLSETTLDQLTSLGKFTKNELKTKKNSTGQHDREKTKQYNNQPNVSFLISIFPL